MSEFTVERQWNHLSGRNLWVIRTPRGYVQMGFATVTFGPKETAVLYGTEAQAMNALAKVMEMPEWLHEWADPEESRG